MPTKPLSRTAISLIICSFISSIIIQFMLWPNYGTDDMNSYIAVIEDQQVFGLIGAYHYYNLHYPPLASVFLYPATLIGGDIHHLLVTQKTLLIKMTLAVFYYSFIGLIFAYYATKVPWAKALKKTHPFLLNIALIEATIILSYFDIMIAPFLLLSFYCVTQKRYFWSGVGLSLAFMTKLLPIVLVPAFLVYFCRKQPHQAFKLDWKSLGWFLIGLTSIVLPLTLIFGYESLKDVVLVSNGHGGYLSSAYNFNRIVAIILQTTTTPALVGYVNRFIFIACIILFLVKLLYSPKTVITLTYACFGIMLSYFVWSNGVHENHLFPALILSMILYLFHPTVFHKSIYYACTLLVFLELFIPYGFGTQFAGHTGLQYFWSFTTLQMQTIHIIISCLAMLFSVIFTIAIVKKQPK